MKLFSLYKKSSGEDSYGFHEIFRLVPCRSEYRGIYHVRYRQGKARRGAWRIPESTLIGVAFLGGSFGAWAGMRYFHHKTRKKKFSVGIPLILVVEYGLAAWLMTSIK